MTNGCDLTINGGIQVSEGNSLTIYAQSEDVDRMGRLTAISNGEDAGIGGNGGIVDDAKINDSGTITIHGGAVTASGGNGAGIGGGFRSGKGGDGGSTTIYSGIVSASGGTGIGGGQGGGDGGGSSNSVTIHGGTVEATGGGWGSAGIGGAGALNSSGGGGGNITITGGVVTAAGASEGAGIGNGRYSNGSTTITITGGVVTATGSKGGSGIGGGYGGNKYSTITISGGIVRATGGDNGSGIGVNGGGNILNWEFSTGENGTALIVAWGGPTSRGAIAPWKEEGDYSGIIFRDGEGTVYGEHTWPAAPAEGWEHIFKEETYRLGLAAGAVLTSAADMPPQVKLEGDSVAQLTATANPEAGGTVKVAYEKWEQNSTTATLTAATNTDENYEFAGWTVTPSDETIDGSTKPQIKVTVKENTVFTANFVQRYTVTLYPNEGAINSGTVTNYICGVGAALPTDVTREGYVFAGWYEDSDFSGQPVTEITAEDSGDKVYYAKWSKLWAVTVETEVGGTVGGGGIYADGTTVTVTATPNSGYHFVRWTENGAEVSRDASYTFPLTADRNLTAEFDRNSSGGSYDSKPTYRPDVEQPEGGAVSVAPRNPEQGDKVTITPNPGEGFQVGDVTVTDPKGNEVEVTDNGDGTFSFIQPNGNVTIEVTFAENAQPPLPFADVPEGAWYEDGGRYVYENGLMAGVSASQFDPDGTTARGQLVTILWRLAGSPAADSPADFTDVAEGDWYAQGAAWAARWGVASGYGDGRFGPDDPITREQLAVMLY